MGAGSNGVPVRPRPQNGTLGPTQAMEPRWARRYAEPRHRIVPTVPTDGKESQDRDTPPSASRSARCGAVDALDPQPSKEEKP